MMSETGAKYALAGEAHGRVQNRKGISRVGDEQIGNRELGIGIGAPTDADC